MRMFTLTLFFLCLFATVFAQTNFQTGLVVLSSGDTMHGAINNREWRTTPLSIEFRAARGLTLYNPGQLRYFELEGGDRYVVFTVKKDMRQIEESKVQP